MSKLFAYLLYFIDRYRLFAWAFLGLAIWAFFSGKFELGMWAILYMSVDDLRDRMGQVQRQLKELQK